jgi:formylglycine-generating enzyme required for sulfatase activity
MSCLNWYAADAFCIWDGGFLPSEAEWINAAAGGSEQRVEPWSVPSSSSTIDCSNANYASACANHWLAVGSDSPKGDGLWGHSDLVGNVAEYTADLFAPGLLSPCTDCARLSLPLPIPPPPFLENAGAHVVRGGAWDGVGGVSSRSGNCWQDDALNCYEDGLRCARTP